MKLVCNKKIYLLLVVSALFLPYSVFASTVYIDTNHSDFFVGDTILFSVRIDSEKKTINATEGTVLLEYSTDLLSLIDINTSGSKFSLWPGKPLPSASNTSISFAGGSPGGVTSKDAIVFNIVLKLQKAGKLSLTPQALSVYLHDGKGTSDEVHVKNLVINVLPKKSDSKSVDDWGHLISNDKIPPEPFEIYVGQEGSIFDGKKFLSFTTTDKQSDVAYYEVLEGDLPPVRSTDTYVLQEQNKPVKVTVTAYDLSGNSREAVYNPTYSYLNLVIKIVLALLLLSITLKFIMFKRRKK